MQTNSKAEEKIKKRNVMIIFKILEIGQIVFTRLTILIFLITGLSIHNSTHACIFVSMSSNDSIFVGFNEDGQDLRAKVWIFPATDKTYGRAFWGFARSLYAYQGGMNDQGLCVDINTCDYTGWADDPKKPNWDTEIDIIDYILSNIATVDEAIYLFNKYDIDLSGTMWVFADADGKSVIFEWVNDQLQILRKNQGYQICTNTIQSNIDIPKKYPCSRWRIADQMIRNQNTPSVNLMRRILSAMCMQSYYCATAYSTICDLVNKKIYLYYYHNFEEVVVFDLMEELAKGGSNYSLQELFEVEPYSLLTQKYIGIQWGDAQLIKNINEKRIKEGLNTFQALKDETQTYNKFLFQEWVLENTGLHLMSNGKIEEAIEIFKINVNEYPESFKVYYRLAEAYRRNNNIELAIENYQKALDKDPDN
ncbi:MAG: tetratricopeptide repeat protein [bacterium]|nr:MAG: tetratricopeptide repeat protein [bacterium]